MTKQNPPLRLKGWPRYWAKPSEPLRYNCAHYRECLDYACRQDDPKQWPGWACARDCPRLELEPEAKAEVQVGCGLSGWCSTGRNYQ